MAQGFGQMVSIMGRKLQVDSFTQYSSEVISSVASKVAEEETFEAFRHICERDSLYIVAEAQAIRTTKREDRKMDDQHLDVERSIEEESSDQDKLDEDIRKAGL